MNNIGAIVAIAAGMLLVTGAGVQAGTCHGLVAGGHYQCTSNDAEESLFTLDFDAQGESVSASLLDAMLTCVCSSTGSLGKPNPEAGHRIACSAPDGANAVFVLSANAQADTLSEGTVAAVAVGARESIPFLCKRVP